MTAAGYVALDDAIARELTPCVECYTPHPSAGRTPLGWGLVGVLVEAVHERGHGENAQHPCVVVQGSIAQGAERVTLCFAPEDLYRAKRPGAVGS